MTSPRQEGRRPIESIETTNLDIYGFEPLAWSRARDALASSPAASGRPYFLGTDALWLVSGPGTRKSRNLGRA
jgi:hypothetical protein